MKNFGKKFLVVALSLILGFVFMLATPTLALAEGKDEPTASAPTVSEEGKAPVIKDEIYDEEFGDTVSGGVVLYTAGYTATREDAEAGNGGALTLNISGAAVSSFSFTFCVPDFVTIDSADFSWELRDAENAVYEYYISENGRRMTVAYSSSVNMSGVDALVINFSFAYAEICSGNPWLEEYEFTDTALNELEVIENFGTISVRESNIRGDVDGNGVVELADVMAIVRSIANPNFALDVSQIDVADIDRDGDVDIRDCQYIQNYLVGLIGSLEDINGGGDVDDGNITIAEAIDIGNSLEANAETEREYILTGEILEIENEYGNTYLTDGKYRIYVYGLYDKEGNRYDVMLDPPVAGDTVQLQGTIKNYVDANGVRKIEIMYAEVLWVKHMADPVPPTEECAHSYDGKVTDRGDCETYKTITYTCKLCGDIYTEQGDLGEHIYVNSECEICGDIMGNGGGEIDLPTANQIGEALQVRMLSEERYIVTGTVAEVLDEKTGRMRIVDETGVSLLVYSFLESDVTVKFGVGETVYLKGTPCKYTVGRNIVVEMVDAEVVAVTEEDLVITTEQFVNIAEALRGGSATTEETYSVFGRIIKIVNAERGQMWIADDWGNELYIYGLYAEMDGAVLYYGEWSEKPRVGDEITVTGQITKYFGGETTFTVEIKDALLAGVYKGAETIDIPMANEIGSGLSVNIESAETYVVTGTVSRIENPTYGKMYLVDSEGNELFIYGFSDPSTTTALKEGDVITVEGIAAKYMSTDGNVIIEMKNAVLVEATESTVLTSILEFNTVATNLQGTTETSEWIEITGTVSDMVNTTYGNFYLTDENGNRLYIYGIYDEGGVRFDALGDNQFKVGDVITVRGHIARFVNRTNVNTIQIKNAVLIEVITEAVSE